MSPIASDRSNSLFSSLLNSSLRFVLILLSCSLAPVAWAACTGASPTWTTTPDYASVSSCVAGAANGDTINVASGSATWSSTLIIGKAVNLIGAGQGVTTITNNVGTLIQVNKTQNSFVRISGFTFDDVDNQTPIVSLVGPIFKVRLDHLTFNKGDSAIGTNWPGAGATGPVYGVVDNSQFINMKRPYFTTDVRSGDSAFGTAAWSEFLASEATYPGSEKMMFFEDDQFIWNASMTDTNGQGALYGQYGGKAAIRHSTFTGYCTYVDAHGDSPDYGTIYYEIYNNTFSESDSLCTQGDIMWMRGGRLIAHDNTFTGSSIPYRMSVYFTTDLTIHRLQNTYYWGNSWNGDTNQADLTLVNDSGQTPAGYSVANIKLNSQYFLQAPQSGQAYYPYTPFTYPHPLRSNSVSPPPNAPTNLHNSVH